jgi:DNA excision repair protein ERCC-6
MLDFVGALLDELGLTFFRIDGDTATSHRQEMIDKFNAGERFACVLSTKVGGVGVNLAGADRVVIIDPDWNPSTDNQALERAWRIGQKRDVSVYRLITVGTIEEKMYKKQIFKQFLSNKILQNPDQKRLFKPQTLMELFRLDTDADSMDISDDDDMEEDTGEVNTDDKELMKSLCEDGDISHVFRHDSLFESNQPPERELAKSQAKVATQRAVDTLKRSVGNHITVISKEGGDRGKVKSANLISRIRDQSAAREVSESLTRKVLLFFRENDGNVTTREVVERFKSDVEASGSVSLLKQILRRVSVLNKKTHIWHLMNRFKI